MQFSIQSTKLFVLTSLLLQPASETMLRCVVFLGSQHLCKGIAPHHWPAVVRHGSHERDSSKLGFVGLPWGDLPIGIRKDIVFWQIALTCRPKHFKLTNTWWNAQRPKSREHFPAILMILRVLSVYIADAQKVLGRRRTDIFSFVSWCQPPSKT